MTIPHASKIGDEDEETKLNKSAVCLKTKRNVEIVFCKTTITILNIIFNDSYIINIKLIL